MDRTELKRRLMGVFRAELEEHLLALDRNVLALETEPRDSAKKELIGSLFRSAHSLKGAARSVDATAIEQACHGLEQAFHELRSGVKVLSPELVQSLFVRIDGLRAAAASFVTCQPVGQLPRAADASVIEATVPAHANALAASAEVQPYLSQAPTQDLESSIVRVTTGKLDQLLAYNHELLAASARMEQRLAAIDGLRSMLTALHLSALRGAERELDRLEELLRRDLTGIEEAVRRVDAGARGLRLVPFLEACEGLERSARDLARSAGKQVELVLEDSKVELDRAIAQKLKAPLLHLLRNAISHGIELAPVREAQGKAPAGKVRIAARLYGTDVEVSVSDDGRGLDLAAVRARASHLGLPDPTDEPELARYVFEPGLSTASVIDRISGQGVGLDAVKKSVEAVHGTIEVSFQPMQGTCFRLRVPLTLSALRSFVVLVAGRPYAIPSSHVQRVMSFTRSDVTMIDGFPMLRSDHGPIKLVSLARILGLPSEATPDTERAVAVVLTAVEHTAAFVVDDLLTEAEQVVRGLPPRLVGLKHLSGATLLSGQRIALVLNPSELCRSALSCTSGPDSQPIHRQVASKVYHLLVVDDSVTTRALLKTILEESGYQVTAVVDGNAAWLALQERAIDLVVSDVEMPHMDGFMLTERIRQSPRFANLPVVLVTSLAGDADRLRGLAAGAHAYLTKAAFDHHALLETISKLL